MEKLKSLYVSEPVNKNELETKHPLDPLTPKEIENVAKIVKTKYGENKVAFNIISLKEPPKFTYYEWREKGGQPPKRLGYYVIVEQKSSKVFEGVVDIGEKMVLDEIEVLGAQPMLTPQALAQTEDIIRKSPEVIEQCKISGIPEDEMKNVYCDAWAIGYDERWGSATRVQQALMYWRSNEDESQYSHPLDFCPVVDTNKGKVISIDIPSRRRKVSKHKHSSYHPPHIKEKFGLPHNESGYRKDDKPINITQPNGVSFSMKGRVIDWSNFKMHIGFNHREGIVLSDLTYNDHGNVRSLFHRISLAEMIVPYGNPVFPHPRKHAMDIGEYGAGFCTNPLSLGCDCKGAIQYLDAHFSGSDGEASTIKNAICIHEEDDGILFKHSDFRDDFQTSVSVRGKRLVISQIFTAANYEYCLYWIFRQDGTIQLEIRLTGILNTYICDDDEDTAPYGTCVYPKVNAHNHQHLFSLRLHPRVDGDNNSASSSDAASAEAPTGSEENPFGNAFYCDKRAFKTVKDSLTDFNGSTGTSWDLYNPSSINPYSGKPASYKLVSTFCPRVLAKEGSLVQKRAPWSKHSVEVVPYKDDSYGYGRIYPSGDHVCQWSGEGNVGIRQWVGDGSDKIENTDIILFHSFGITHFPAPEDFPVMPTEIFGLMLRPRHFFKENPCLDIKPSYAMTTSEIKKGKSCHGNCINEDKASKALDLA